MYKLWVLFREIQVVVILERIDEELMDDHFLSTVAWTIESFLCTVFCISDKTYFYGEK